MAGGFAALGEPLIQLNALTRGPLRYVRYFESHVAGSELNFCVAAVRNGMPCSMVARVGNDEFGREVLEYARGIGIDVSQVRGCELPTGVYFVQRGYPLPDSSELVYYRKGSAGSSLSPEDVDEDLIKSCALAHSSGITLALGRGPREAVTKAFELAPKRGFDTNIRLRLWGADEARGAIGSLLDRFDFDLLVTDQEDTEILLGVTDPEEAYSAYSKRGVKCLLYKLGAQGAIAFCEEGEFREPGYSVSVEDPTGAGDALAGTFASLYFSGKGVDYALRHAVAASALVVTVRGNNEITPGEKDAEKMISHLRGGRMPSSPTGRNPPGADPPKSDL